MSAPGEAGDPGDPDQMAPRRGPETVWSAAAGTRPPAPRRDYEALRRRWRVLRRAALRCTQIGVIDGYAIDRLDLMGAAPAPVRLLLSAGTHGDEPAGPEAVVAFLQEQAAALAGRVDVVVLPCINPWGYVHDCRANAAGVDINRAFEDDGAPEATLVKTVLADERFDLFVEFHEDWEFAGYYLFECRDAIPALGPGIVARVRDLGPVYDLPSVDDVPVVDGVATATPALLESHQIGMKPMPIWLFRSGRAPRTITSETPSTHWPLERRVAAHRAALDVALTHLLQGPP